MVAHPPISSWTIVLLCLALSMTGVAVPAPVFIEQASAPRSSEGGVLFTYENSEAVRVYIAGDFNNWANSEEGKVKDKAALMERAAPNGVWFKVVELPRGEAHYKFVVVDREGKWEWVADPSGTGKDSEGNSVHDPGDSAALITYFSSPDIQILYSAARNDMTVRFLTGNIVQQVAVLPPIELDGKVQKDLQVDADKPGRVFNDAISIQFEKPSTRSASMTFQAHDGSVHDWNFRVEGDDSYYGGGERFNSINQKTYMLPMVSRDNPNEKGVGTYKPVPFVMFSRGFGLWIDSYTPGLFDLNATQRWISNFRYRENKLRVVLIGGPKYSEILREYTGLTGRPPMLPVWAFAPWKSRNVHKSREDVLEDVEKYRRYDLPASVLVIDSPWERGYNDFVLNDDQFTDPEAMFKRVRELGFYTCLWLTPFVNSENRHDMKGIKAGESSNFREAAEAGYLVKNSAGDVMITKWWKGEGGIVDFTNPDAANWWLDQLDKAKKWGVKAWKCDDGEGDFVEDAVLFDGTRPDQMKGRFAYLYLETMQRHIDERLGGDGLLFVRPGFAGTQKFPVGWAGDNNASFSFENGFPGVIRAAQTAALSGLPLWACDIAGYHGNQTPEIFARWTEFSCFNTLMHLHMTSNLGPWDFGEEYLEIYRKYAKLHTQLFPYIYEAVREAHETGMPVMRPMVLAFQGDAEAAEQEFQFMFGPDLLVAPMYQAGTHRSVYLPKDTSWVDWWTGEELSGGQTIERHVPIDQIPVFVRTGAVIPMIPEDIDTLVPRTEETAKEVVTLDSRRILQVWPGEKVTSSWDGIDVKGSRDGQVMRFTVSSRQARPLEIRFMHRVYTATMRGKDAAFEVGLNEERNATCLRAGNFSGEVTIELTSP
jgi:alpha-D-xyloside xylohydrolase